MRFWEIVNAFAERTGLGRCRFGDGVENGEVSILVLGRILNVIGENGEEGRLHVLSLGRLACATEPSGILARDWFGTLRIEKKYNAVAEDDLAVYYYERSSQ